MLPSSLKSEYFPACRLLDFAVGRSSALIVELNGILMAMNKVEKTYNFKCLRATKKPCLDCKKGKDLFLFFSIITVCKIC